MKVALVGKMRSGKDTVARYFIERDKACKMAFGDGIKKVANMYFPDIVNKGKPRKLYQTIGQDFRKIDPDVWVKDLSMRFTLLKMSGIENFVVTDVRQMNEYQYLKRQGFTIIKVEADDELRKERIISSGDVFEPEDFYHETETAVDSIPFDYEVSNNDTLEALLDQLEYIENELKGEEKQ